VLPTGSENGSTALSHLHFISQQQLVQAALVMHRTLNLNQDSSQCTEASARAHRLFVGADC
jgi:hypothetical protein